MTFVAVSKCCSGFAHFSRHVAFIQSNSVIVVRSVHVMCFCHSVAIYTVIFLLFSQTVYRRYSQFFPGTRYRVDGLYSYEHYVPGTRDYVTCNIRNSVSRVCSHYILDAFCNHRNLVCSTEGAPYYFCKLSLYSMERQRHSSKGLRKEIVLR